MKKDLSFDIEPDGFFEEEGFSMMETVTNFMKFHQQGAIELTRLVLDHCKEKEITKEYVFDVFAEATNIMKAQFNDDN